jgi:hypothetical protein
LGQCSQRFDDALFHVLDPRCWAHPNDIAGADLAWLRHGSSVDKGENARLSSFVGATAIADMMKPTLGPKGMDKILQRISEHDQSVSVPMMVLLFSAP